MTTHTVNRTLPTRTDGARRRTVEQPARRLRTVLGLNAATSLAAGLAGLVAAPYWADTLGVDSTAWIRIVGAGLVIFAVDVALVAARATRWLAPATLAISIGDLAWVVGTAVALATVDFTTTGRIVATVMGVGVLDFALLQLWYRSRLA